MVYNVLLEGLELPVLKRFILMKKKNDFRKGGCLAFIFLSFYWISKFSKIVIFNKSQNVNGKTQSGVRSIRKK